MIRKYITICHSAGKNSTNVSSFAAESCGFVVLLKEGRVGACFSGFSPSRFLLKPQQEP